MPNDLCRFSIDFRLSAFNILHRAHGAFADGNGCACVRVCMCKLIINNEHSRYPPSEQQRNEKIPNLSGLFYSMTIDQLCSCALCIALVVLLLNIFLFFDFTASAALGFHYNAEHRRIRTQFVVQCALRISLSLEFKTNKNPLKLSVNPNYIIILFCFATFYNSPREAIKKLILFHFLFFFFPLQMPAQVEQHRNHDLQRQHLGQT